MSNSPDTRETNFEPKTLAQLDYYRIRNDVAGCCVSQDGKTELEQRDPLTDREEIARLKAEAAEWTVYLNSARASALSSWEPVLRLTDMLAVEGAALELDDVRMLNTFCTVTLHAAQTIARAAKELPLPLLADLAARIPDTGQPAQLIGRIIDPAGQLRDLPELRAIREHIGRLRREIDSLIRNYTADTALRDTLQSDVPVLRADRQVLAVRAGSKNKIRGIIHEVSQTGQTVYIEPDDVVRKNNDLVQEQFKLDAEIRRILRDLTAQLSPFKDDIVNARQCMIRLDVTHAAARWGIEQKAVFAADTEAQPVLVQARHPLLGAKAVPIDLAFPKDCRVLIITGPNTGGKTVTLKTVALFTLLNQSGFPVPAKEGTRLPVRTGVFADIGDEQSLDQSLSTFSGHMKNIADTLTRADSDSLVLLDELGSGTDPQEGGAIAMAVLDALIEKRSFVLVTTHHGVLKNYGYTHRACVNASAEFDETTLAPTYRIRTGIPGESRALDIARRNGLPPEVVDKAASYLISEQADVSAMIRGLTAKHEAADLLEKQLRQDQQRLREQRRAADLKSLRLKQTEWELAHEGNRETRRFLEESRKMLENLVRELREGEITREKTRAVKRFITELAQNVQERGDLLDEQEESLAREQAAFTEREKQYETAAAKPPHTAKKRLKNADAFAAAKSAAQDGQAFGTRTDDSRSLPGFEAGTEVLTGSANRRGTLLRKSGKNSWIVQVGSMKLTLKEKDLTPVAPHAAEKPSVTVDFAAETSSGYGETGKAEDDAGRDARNRNDAVPAFELRLLGMRYEEAVKALERQLDLASIRGLHDFSIIHGKGSGVLQQAVQDYLAHYPGVAEFHFARPEDGGTGKTYVHLDTN
ncbi:endonuclease MutS2 [Treponema brennaborense]|uniref:Endonuclease MutS2 n=1 Tax=Treponema brennaborense (strain DSM 12168 / CIP 105900 / DD5/3) TaxID=906968 RepID=F4LQ06_TREBD|nr:Smr/MutS family protein [Treponema brennaborense]AEE17084.1 MutS2 protein [Treponema brennaborense DSM 12168]